MDIKAVVFDLDGTLYDNSSLPLRMVLSDLFHLKYMVAERKVRRRLTKTSKEDFIKAVAASAGSGSGQVADWFDNRYMPTMTAILKRSFRAKPWVAPLLSELRDKGIRTAVFSDYGCIGEKLEAIGLDRAAFDVTADALSLGGLKPYGPSFLKVAEMLGIDPSHILVVGDRDDTDGEGARNAGMKFQLAGKKDSDKLELNL